MNKLGRHLALLLALALSASCALTAARQPKATGFTGSAVFKMMKKGGDNDWALVYRKPGVDWPSYNKLILEPVTIWDDPETRKVSPQDRQRLANNFYKLLYASTSRTFTMVSEAGPGTLTARVALTDIHASNRTLDTVSSVVPQLRAVTTLAGYATGKPAFTGEAAFAFKLIDSQTGELLGAAAEKRVGNRSISGSTKSWSDVDDAMEYWANLVGYRSCVMRKLGDCEEPAVPRGF